MFLWRACMHDYCINYEIITHTCDYIIAGLGVISTSYNKQLLDEAEHDMKNYAERGECCRPRLNAEVDKFTRFYYYSCKDQDHLFLHSFFSIFSNAMIDCKLPVRPKPWQRVIVR